MYKTHRLSRSARDPGEGRGATRVERRPAAAPTPDDADHRLLDEQGTPIGHIIKTDTQPEFGRLEPTLLLQREARAGSKANSGHEKGSSPSSMGDAGREDGKS